MMATTARGRPPEKNIVAHKRRALTVDDWSRDEKRHQAARERRADARRKVLRTLMEDRGLTPSLLAKMAGVAESSITNFIGGWYSGVGKHGKQRPRPLSYSLSLETAEPVARALGISINELVGEPIPYSIRGNDVRIVGKDGIRYKPVRGEIVFLVGEIGGKTGLQWSREQWVEYALPKQHPFESVTLLYHLVSPDMNDAQPPWPPHQTALRVVKLEDFNRQLRTGDRVIVLRETPEGQELVCREVRDISDGEPKAALVPRSTKKLRTFEVDWPIVPGAVTESRGEKISVYAVVTGVFNDLLGE